MPAYCINMVHVLSSIDLLFAAFYKYIPDGDLLSVTEKKNFFLIAKEAKGDPRLKDCYRQWNAASKVTTYTNGKVALDWFLKNPKAIMIGPEEPDTSAPGMPGGSQQAKRRVVKQMVVPENF